MFYACTISLPFLTVFSVWRVISGRAAAYTEVQLVLKLLSATCKSHLIAASTCFVIIGKGLRFTEHWGQLGRVMRDRVVLNLS